MSKIAVIRSFLVILLLCIIWLPQITAQNFQENHPFKDAIFPRWLSELELKYNNAKRYGKEMEALKSYYVYIIYKNNKKAIQIWQPDGDEVLFNILFELDNKQNIKMSLYDGKDRPKMVKAIYDLYFHNVLKYPMEKLGFNAGEFKEAKVTITELSHIGYTKTGLLRSGFTEKELSLSGL
ncbi:MAG: hypothetical protein IH946_03720 [Bacteroidetes bacterium]|nr:hypothetical protein [Bacteroidota bacterium]